MNLNDIEVDSVTKRFQDTLAVDDVSVNVTRGELFGLLGPNGAGKSTLTKMLSGMINPTSGTIKVGGYNIKDDPMKVKELLGVVPQDIVTTVLAGKFISSLAIVYLSAVIMLISGILIFQVNLYWNIPAIVLAIFLGALSAIGIGLIISSLAKNEEAANSIAVLISVPLQFFIGSFFPLDIMPKPARIFRRGSSVHQTSLCNAGYYD